MVSAVAEFVRPLAARQGIAVKVATDAAVPPMEIDRTLLRQAVLNLVKNGIEAVSQGGSLTLTTAGAGRHGGDRGDRQRGRHPAGGRAAPLRAVLHHQAAGHRARPLHLAPDRRGARRQDPLAAARPARAPPSPCRCPIQEARACLSPRAVATLLVADDDPAVRQSLERTLTREGYAVVLAPDGQAALERLQAGGVDLVLSDLKMPGLTGLELLREAKAVAPDVDVILLTAFGTVEEAVRAMKDGAYDFLTKPFQRAQLIKVVRQALERRDAHRARTARCRSASTTCCGRAT